MGIRLLHKYTKTQSIPLELSILEILSKSENNNTPEKTEALF